MGLALNLNVMGVSLLTGSLIDGNRIRKGRKRNRHWEDGRGEINDEEPTRGCHSCVTVIKSTHVSKSPSSRSVRNSSVVKTHQRYFHQMSLLSLFKTNHGFS